MSQDYNSMDLTRKPFFCLAIAAVLTGAFSASYAADPLPETFDARAMALGGAVSSLPGNSMAVRANPATLSLRRGFFAGMTYLNRDKGQLDAVAVTVVDNSSSQFAGAIQYVRAVGNMEAEDFGVTMASNMGKYAMGTTVRYVHARNDRNDDWDGAFVADIGILLRRDSGLRIAVVARDLFASSLDWLETRAALGISMDDIFGFNLSADYVRYFDHNLDNGSTVHLGAEWSPLQSPWTLRLGQQWNALTTEDFQSIGLGWTDRRFDFGYAFQQNRQDPGKTIHVVSISSPF
jgi:hypothetical protein